MACTQTYAWTDTTNSCALISISPSIVKNNDIETGKDAGECCDAFHSGDPGSESPDPLSMACSSIIAHIWDNATDKCTRTTKFEDS